MLGSRHAPCRQGTCSDSFNYLVSDETKYWNVFAGKVEYRLAWEKIYAVI